jgi:hypothetical protein
MRPTTNTLKGIFGGHEHVTAEDTAQRFALGGGPMGEVGQGARFDLTILTVTFAQENGWW